MSKQKRKLKKNQVAIDGKLYDVTHPMYAQLYEDKIAPGEIVWDEDNQEWITTAKTAYSTAPKWNPKLSKAKNDEIYEKWQKKQDPDYVAKEIRKATGNFVTGLAQGAGAFGLGIGEIMNTPLAAIGEVISGRNDFNSILPNMERALSNVGVGEYKGNQQMTPGSALFPNNPIAAAILDIPADILLTRGANTLLKQGSKQVPKLLSFTSKAIGKVPKVNLADINKFKNQEGIDYVKNVTSDPRYAQKAKELDVKYSDVPTQERPVSNNSTLTDQQQTTGFNPFASQLTNRQIVARRTRRNNPYEPSQMFGPIQNRHLFEDAAGPFTRMANYTQTPEYYNKIFTDVDFVDEYLKQINKSIDDLTPEEIRTAKDLLTQNGIFYPGVEDIQVRTKTALPHELKHKEHYTKKWKSQLPEKYKEAVSQNFDETDVTDDYTKYRLSPEEQEAWLSRDLKKSMVDKGYLETPFDEIDEATLDKFIETDYEIFTPELVQRLNKPNFLKWVNKTLPVVTGVTTASAIGSQLIPQEESAPEQKAYGGKINKKKKLPKYQTGGPVEPIEPANTSSIDFLKQMANSPLFNERYAMMTNNPTGDISAEANDYRNFINNNLNTVKIGDYENSDKGSWEGVYHPQFSEDEKNTMNTQLQNLEKSKQKFIEDYGYTTIMDNPHLTESLLNYAKNIRSYKSKVNNPHTIFINENQDLPATELHELSHASTLGRKGLKYFNTPFTIDEANLPEEFKGIYSDKEYYERPTEVKARVDAIRKWMLENNMYDSVNERFEKKHYDELKKNLELTPLKGMSKENSLKTQIQDLMIPFKEDDVIRMFNSFVSNQNNTPITTAAYGGKITNMKKNKLPKMNWGGKLAPKLFDLAANALVNSTTYAVTDMIKAIREPEQEMRPTKMNTGFTMANGGMIKRADGSYSKRGLWDNIRANKGSGKKPTKKMLEQERKINSEMAYGGTIDPSMYMQQLMYGSYATGGEVPQNIPVEVEGGEAYELPNGEMGEFEGPSHDNGGIPVALPEQTKVYSKQLKVNGKTMADRKTKREANVAKLEKILSKNPSDKFIKEALKRQQETAALEEQQDMAMQEQANQQQQMQQQAQQGMMQEQAMAGMMQDPAMMQQMGMMMYGGKLDNGTPPYGLLNYVSPTLSNAVKKYQQELDTNKQAYQNIIPTDNYKGLDFQIIEDLEYDKDENPINVIYDDYNKNSSPKTTSTGRLPRMLGNLAGTVTGIHNFNRLTNPIKKAFEPLSNNPFSSDVNMDLLNKSGSKNLQALNLIKTLESDVATNIANNTNPYDAMGNVLGNTLQNPGQLLGNPLVDYNSAMPDYISTKKGVVNLKDNPQGVVNQMFTSPSADANVAVEPGSNENKFMNFLNNAVDKTGDFFSGLFDKNGKPKKEGTKKDEKGLPLTAGDRMGMAGTLFGGLAPMTTTMLNRMMTPKNQNFFREYGAEGLRAMQEAQALSGINRDKQLADIKMGEEASRQRGRNSARGVNTLRAMDVAADITANQSQNQAYNMYAQQMMQLLGQKAQMENQQDQAVMQGEYTRDLADRQDVDQFYTNLAENFASQSELMQKQGRDMNQAQYNKMILQMSPMFSKYGIGMDVRNGQYVLTYNGEDIDQTKARLIVEKGIEAEKKAALEKEKAAGTTTGTVTPNTTITPNAPVAPINSNKISAINPSGLGHTAYFNPIFTDLNIPTVTDKSLIKSATKRR